MTFENKSKNTENIEETKKLVGRMQAHLPISVRPGVELKRVMRKMGFAISNSQTLSIKGVFYGGDEMGIACDITLEGKEKEPILCSLTQMEVLDQTPLGDEIRSYQAERLKRLGQIPGRRTSVVTVNL